MRVIIPEQLSDIIFHESAKIMGDLTAMHEHERLSIMNLNFGKAVPRWNTKLFNVLKKHEDFEVGGVNGKVLIWKGTHNVWFARQTLGSCALISLKK